MDRDDTVNIDDRRLRLKKWVSLLNGQNTDVGLDHDSSFEEEEQAIARETESSCQHLIWEQVKNGQNRLMNYKYMYKQTGNSNVLHGNEATNHRSNLHSTAAKYHSMNDMNVTHGQPGCSGINSRKEKIRPRNGVSLYDEPSIKVIRREDLGPGGSSSGSGEPTSGKNEEQHIINRSNTNL